MNLALTGSRSLGGSARRFQRPPVLTRGPSVPWPLPPPRFHLGRIDKGRRQKRPADLLLPDAHVCGIIVTCACTRAAKRPIEAKAREVVDPSVRCGAGQGELRNAEGDHAQRPHFPRQGA